MSVAGKYQMAKWRATETCAACGFERWSTRYKEHDCPEDGEEQRAILAERKER